MSALFPDTTPEAEAMLLRLLHDVPAWRKFEMVAQLNATVRQFALNGLRDQYPEADEAELRRRLADILLGPGLAAKVYGPFPLPETAGVT